MTAILIGVQGDRRALAWCAAMVLVAALRLLSARAWRRDPAARDRTGFWSVIGCCGTFAAGLALGGGAAWLWPASETWQLFWVFLVGGMCAGAAGLHHAHLPAVLAFILPAGLPLVARYALEGSERGLAAAAMILVFLGALTLSACRSSREFAANLRLRLSLAQQAQALDAANQRLREEMARHRATEESLRQAQKMEAVGQLTGGIAHDFNNLLTVVLGSLALLRKRLPEGDERAARLLENALQGAQRGAALTQRLLAFGRRQVLNPALVELPKLVQGMADLLRGALGAGTHLRCDFPPGLPPVHVDANQLELALLNLVANARDAMPRGGEVAISAEERQVMRGEPGGLPPGPYVVLSVADAGEGMDEAVLAQAMEPFFTTKGVGKGTGLGLPMVHGFAAQSGGRFTLHSARGVGTVAELWLPRAGAVPAGRPEPQAAPLPATRRGTVLLVDDDPLVLASTAAMLEDLGHVAVEAASGPAAIELLRGGVQADLVITDFAMPGMTGLQLAEAVRRIRPGLPVLLATGYAEVQEAVLPGVPRLPKPFEQAALARAVAECLSGAGAAPG
ncbi:ATP-binding protein [Roseicella aerolata]|uniref:histidine kinase n=1 Tax=Roseicella aerolata TaxID=2883479 RepID=A0A9X1L9Y5_9PROT|nr:ATP-binding protein [Roseicella aerolata]MCB4821603.1 response regulator [Roseicella aerolata]